VARRERERRGRVRRVGGILLSTVLVLLAIVVSSVLIVLYVPAASQAVLARAVNWYAERIPGDVILGETQGAFAREIRVLAVRLDDARGQTVVSARMVGLRLRPAPLLLGAVRLELTVDDSVVHLWPEGGFSDLVPESDEPRPPPDQIGPDFPVSIGADIELRNADVIQHADDGTRTSVVRGLRLRGHVAARNREASLAIERASGRFFDEVTVTRLQADAHWSAPRLELERLVVTSNEGRIDHAQGSWNAENGAFSADLGASIDPGVVVDDPGALDLFEDVDAIELTAHTSGTPRGMWAWVEAAAGDRLQARVSGFGAFSPRASAALDWLVEVNPPGIAPVRAHGLAALRQRDGGNEVSAFTVCTSCPEPVLVTLDAVMAGQWWSARSMVWLPRLTVRTRARGTASGLSRAALELDLQDTGPLRRALAPWFEIPEVDARATARVQCRGALVDVCGFEATAVDMSTPAVAARRIVTRGVVRLVDGRRRTDAELRVEGLRRDDTTIGDIDISARGTLDEVELAGRLDGPAGTSATVEMLVQPAQRTLIDLRHLLVAHRGLHATLIDPSQLEVSRDELTIDDLRLQIGTGSLQAHGRLSTRVASDLRVTLNDLELSDIDPLLPGPTLQGVVSSSLALRGTLEDPELQLDLRGRGLMIDEVPVGTLETRLMLRDDTLDGQIVARDGLARFTRVALRIPVSVDLSERGAERRVTVPRRGRLHVDAVVGGLALSALHQMVATLPPLGGTVDARVRVDGSMQAPVLAGRVAGRDLVLERGRIGDATALVSYEDDRAQLRLRLQGPIARRLEAQVSLPMTVDLAASRVDVHEHRELSVDVRGERVDLATPRRWTDTWLASGEADVRLTGQGSLSDWHAHTVVRARELAYDDRPVGDALVDLEVTTEHGDLDLRVTGPIARRLHLRARAPLRTEEDAVLPTWDPHALHVVDALLQGVDIATLRHMAPAVPVSGLIDGMVHLEGSVDDASGVVDLSTRRLTWRGQRLGRVWAAARYDGDRLVALAEQQSGLGEWIRARVEAPIALIDHAPYLQWRTSDPHRLTVHAAGVDEQLVGAFVDLPAEARLVTSARVMGVGNLDDFRIDGQIRGNIGRHTTVGTSFSADIALEPHEQELRAMVGAAAIEQANVVARTRAPLVDLARGDAVLGDVPFELTVGADRLPLQSFEPLLPASLDELHGVVQARAFGSGTIGSPDLSGFVEIQDGAVTAVPMYQRFEGADVFVVFDGPRIRLEQFDVRSGRGRTRGRGQVLLENGGLRAHAVLRTRQLPIVRPGLPIMTLDTRLVATVDTRQDVTDVSVTADDLRVNVLATNVEAPAPIPQSDAVVQLDRRGPAAPDAEPEGFATEASPSDLRLRFRLDKPAVVIGPDVDMEWDGAVEVMRVGGSTRVTGALEATRGRIGLLGRDFDVERGLITLPEEEVIDPFVDLVATTQMPDAAVTITVRGRASRPDLRLSSSPAMPETEVFSLLVTGVPGGAREEGTEFDAQAAAMLAAFNNPVLSRTLRESIGLDRVGLAFGEDIEQPILTVGKRLTRRLYLETRYHHDAPLHANTAEVRLDYAFKPPRWSLQTHFGDAAIGGIEIWWQRRFGGGRRREEQPSTAPASDPVPTGPSR
jgi:hypothetical protein